MNSIPAIGLAPFLNGTAQEQETVAREVDRACSSLAENITVAACEGDLVKPRHQIVFMTDAICGFNLRRHNGGLTGPGPDVSFDNIEAVHQSFG